MTYPGCGVRTREDREVVSDHIVAQTGLDPVPGVRSITSGLLSVAACPKKVNGGHRIKWSSKLTSQVRVDKCRRQAVLAQTAVERLKARRGNRKARRKPGCGPFDAACAEDPVQPVGPTSIGPRAEAKDEWSKIEVRES